MNNEPPPDPSWFVNEEPDIPPPIHHDLAPKKAPFWVKKESFPQLKGPGAPRKVAEPPLKRKNSVTGPRVVDPLPDWKNSVACLRIVDPPPNKKNSVASLRIVDRPSNTKLLVARPRVAKPRMALKLLDTVEPVKPTEMAEIEEPTGTEEPTKTEETTRTEKPTGNEKKGQRGGRKKWNRVSLK